LNSRILENCLCSTACQLIQCLQVIWAPVFSFVPCWRCLLATRCVRRSLVYFWIQSALHPLFSKKLDAWGLIVSSAMQLGYTASTLTVMPQRTVSQSATAGSRPLEKVPCQHPPMEEHHVFYERQRMARSIIQSEMPSVRA